MMVFVMVLVLLMVFVMVLVLVLVFVMVVIEFLKVSKQLWSKLGAMMILLALLSLKYVLGGRKHHLGHDVQGIPKGRRNRNGNLLLVQSLFLKIKKFQKKNPKILP